ncbi:conserved hypothetical protein (plasmid) [Acaryochloris marina MBIC11017]|uniref:Uncharacterized protein n=1 Tax=Acaryochloris marina (strain MBIC 11017) TaxID=329726 RepID=A8ZPV0_ACAM1|nr:conserved hypothetical protein [Acaryochloris marina MBIC11017]
MDYYSPDVSKSVQKKGKGKTVSEAESKAAALRKLVRAQWYGYGAYALGLQGNVHRADFKKVFYGYNLEGERLRGFPKNEKHKERVGDDFTFSMPKSASMVLHIGCDYRLFDAHLQAVKRTLDIVQERYGQTRVMIGGVRHTLNTKNLVIALINHHTSRANDPQVHTHALVMNTTQMPDGTWRSRKNDLMYMQECLGQIYRQYLAENIQNLGYKIYATKDAFEIEGITREQVETFSKRSQQIFKQLEKDGLEATTANKQTACLKSRKAKEPGQKLTDLQAVWQQAAQTLDYRMPQPDLSPQFEYRPDQVTTALHSAINHLSERSITFTREQIEQFVFGNIRQFRFEDISQAMSACEELLTLRDQVNNTERFTTVAALEREAAIHQSWDLGRQTQTPLMSEYSVRELLKESGLNVGQLEAVAKTLAHSDQFILWHGLAGVGKTRTLGQLKQVLTHLNLDIQGYAPTTKASKVLGKELGIKTNTVAKLLVSKPSLAPHQLWIVDEAGMIGSQQMLELLGRARAANARVLFVGDTKQNPSITAGSPMRSLIRAGATTFHISQIVRQRNTVQKRAVSLIAKGQGLNAVSLLKEHGYIQEIKDEDIRQQTFADYYLQLSPEERAETLLVTGTNKERLAIMSLLRQGLKAEGTLGEEDHHIQQLASRHLTIEQKRLVQFYQVGDYIQLQKKNYRSTPLQKDKLYRVERRLGDELLVSSSGGRLYHFNPSKYKHKEVYEVQNLNVAVGDDLRWTHNNKEQKWSNGDEVKVVAIEGSTLHVIDEEGQHRTISLDHPVCLDYALVHTAHRAQGQSRKRVVISSTNDPTSSKEPFYVKISRQSHEIVIYCQSFKKLDERVSESIAQDNATELLKDYHEQSGSQIGHDSGAPEDYPGRTANPSHGDGNSQSVRSRSGGENRYIEPPRQPGVGDVTPSRQGRTPALHRTAPRRLGRPEVGEDGGIHRQINESNGGSDPEDELLRYDLPATERGSGDGGRGDQVHQTTTPEQRSLDFSDAHQRQERSQLGDALAGLARSWTAYQNAQLIVASGLDQAVNQLSEGMEEPQPPTYDMGNLAASITQRQEQQDLTEHLTQIQYVLDQIDEAVEQVTYREQIRAMDAGLQEWQASRGLTDAIAEVEADQPDAVEHLDAALERAEAQPVLYPQMQRLVRSIREWQSQQQLVNALAPIAETIQQLQGHQYQGMAGLAKTITQHQNIQALSESGVLEQIQQQVERLNSPIYPSMGALAEKIQTVQAQREIYESLAQLTEALEQLPIQPYQYQGMGQLAQTWQTHQDMQALDQLGLLDKLDRLTQQVAQVNQADYAGMAKLAGTIHDINAEKTLLNSGLEASLAELATSIEQLQSQPSIYEYEGMKNLAEAIAQRRAEAAITQHLEGVDEAVKQVQQMIGQTLEMQELGQTVRDMREVGAVAEGPITEELKTLAERLQGKGINITPKPKFIKVFWTPETNPKKLMEASFPIAEGHWQELLAGSGIHPDLAELNCETIAGQEILERLLSTKIEDMGAGQVVVKEISEEFAKLRDVPDGGFWIKAGVLASSLDDPEPTESLWGSLKPDHPRMDYRRNRPQKYEHPADVSREIFLTHVPEWLAQTIYDQYGITPRPGKHFWSVVKDNPQIPINITEGGKKTLAVNSQGHVTIGLPGVNGGYRANDDNKKKLPIRQLHPGLAVFAVPGRHFNFLYDQETKPLTIVNVRQDLVRAGELLVKEGCSVSASKWDNQHKGVDDLIVGAGPKQLELAISRTRPFEEIALKHYQYRYRKLVEFVQRRDGDLAPERMDLEVFMEASRRGELEDGYRFIEAGSKHIYEREYLMEKALELQKHKTEVGMAMVPIVQAMAQKHGSQHGRVRVYFTPSWVMTHGPLTTMIREKESNRVLLRYRAGHLLHVTAQAQTLSEFQKTTQPIDQEVENQRNSLASQTCAAVRVITHAYGQEEAQGGDYVSEGDNWRLRSGRGYTSITDKHTGQVILEVKVGQILRMSDNPEVQAKFEDLGQLANEITQEQQQHQRRSPRR